jgi:hypothetical protein
MSNDAMDRRWHAYRMARKHMKDSEDGLATTSICSKDLIVVVLNLNS